eukprot:TRINITY_DN18898_c0_g1_i1.p1 TRINITY_DN18898_c0_g1~~TRINITY_DN18898_c0_g1_i1.p1  ORF type:complete len:347 (+),score=167.95 TRINITY_DN18898_c0_g1_i1:38-1042(+)
MGKKKHARPGLDGIAPGAISKAPSKKDRRIAERATKKTKKRLTPGKGSQKSELEKLRKEREAALRNREKRRAELAKKGALYSDEPKAEGALKIAVPPYRTNVSVRKNILYYEVSLHKVPMKYISVNTTEDRFQVETLEYSKQWVLDVPHPDGIKVYPNEDCGLAELTPDGILKVKLKIKHLPESVKKREAAKQESITNVRNLRFRRNRAGELVTGKRKVTVVADTKSDSEPKKKKKKTFVTDRNAALELIDGIQKEEEPKKQERKTMLDHVQDMKAERKERRIAKKQKKQTMEDQAIRSIAKGKKAKQKREMEKALSEVVPLKKPTGQKVRFSS